MKRMKLGGAVAAISLVVTLTACGNANSTSSSATSVDPTEAAKQLIASVELSATTTETGTGMSISANETTSQAANMGTIQVGEGDNIVCISRLSAGKVHIVVTVPNSGDVVSERDVTPGAFYTELVEPGTYEIIASAKDATGQVYLAAADEDEVSQAVSALKQQEMASAYPEMVQTTTPGVDADTSSEAAGSSEDQSDRSADQAPADQAPADQAPADQAAETSSQAE